MSRLVRVIDDGRATTRPDHPATEEPLEIPLVAGGTHQRVAVTMRTPGANFELAVGFLFAEGVIAGRGDVRRLTYCTDPDVDGDVNVELAGSVTSDLRSLERHFFTTSACGVCGRATLEALELRGCTQRRGGPVLAVEKLYALPKRLRAGQGLFDATGGLHAAGLFDAAGDLLAGRRTSAAITPSTSSSVGPSCKEGCPSTTTYCWSAGAPVTSSCRRRRRRPADGVRHLRAEQPRRRPRRAVRRDARGLPARPALQRLTHPRRVLVETS